MFLKQEAVASLVIESLALMANHVHVLLLPLVPPNQLLKSLKGFTAREANRLLNRTGQPFWQQVI